LIFRRVSIFNLMDKLIQNFKSCNSLLLLNICCIQVG
jgi:hypothetical protein